MSERKKTPEPATPAHWPGSSTEFRSTGTLRPYDRNARTHTPEQIEQICNSIEQWGFTIPILIDDSNTVIAGHARLAAAQKLRLPEVPCIVARDWTEQQKRAYVIADNALTDASEWAEELLIAELSALEPELRRLAGFDDEQWSKLTDEPPPPLDQDTSPQLEGLTYSIVIRCASEQNQLALLNRFEAEGLRCEALIS